jgi:hypothetical protein
LEKSLREIIKKSITYSISGIKNFKTVLFPHFKNFPLLKQKAADLILFVKIIEIMFTKEHLTIEGLHKIINIRASII